jgi:hypothetical protein
MIGRNTGESLKLHLMFTFLHSFDFDAYHLSESNFIITADVVVVEI